MRHPRYSTSRRRTTYAASSTTGNHIGAFDVSVNEHQAVKGIKPRQNLRDSMTTLELLLTALTEETAATLHRARDTQGYPALADDAREAGEVGGATRRDIEACSGQPVVSGANYKTPRQCTDLVTSR